MIPVTSFVEILGLGKVLHIFGCGIKVKYVSSIQ